MDLVHAARREAAQLVRAVEVGQHLHRHLRHGLGAERGLDVAAIDLLVAIDGVWRAALALQLDDPIREQIVHYRPRSGVPALGHLVDQLGSRLIRVAQVPAEHAADRRPTRESAIIPSDLCGAGGDRTHDPGIMSRRRSVRVVPCSAVEQQFVRRGVGLVMPCATRYRRVSWMECWMAPSDFRR